MLKPTTALRKIARLTKRIWVIQGGQGAAKTFSILIILINHARNKPGKEIFIASAELSKMRITIIKDFVKIMKAIGIYNDRRFKGDTLYEFENGSFIKFIGLDKEDIGKGLRSDVVFINEANKVPFETYRELTSRAKRVILDFNPNGEFYAHTEVLTRDDAELLILTSEDNEFLSEQERHEIRLYKEKAYINPDIPKYDVDSNVKSKYWRNKWIIYGLGQIGMSPNRIFFWDEIPDEVYHKIEAKKYVGVDWGTVDPWGILEAKYYDGALYLHELNYASENEIREGMTPEERDKISKSEEGIVRWMFEETLKIDKKTNIICDNNRPLKIQSLWDMGYDYTMAAPKPPGSIIDGVSLINDIPVYYTSSSKNLKHEMENYEREVDRYGKVLEEPIDANNHLCDCARYLALWLSLMGIIKSDKKAA